MTDFKGNRLRADIPYNLFSMLVEFRQAALRAQTQQIENSTRPGSYKGSLVTLGEPAPNNSQVDSPAPETARHGRTHRQSESRLQLEALFSQPRANSNQSSYVATPLESQCSDEGTHLSTEHSPKRGRPPGESRRSARLFSEGIPHPYT
jgi:hypothetical protein